jgi:hypothetical protein
MTFADLFLIHMANTNVEALSKGEKENRTKSMLNMAFIKSQIVKKQTPKSRCLRAYSLCRINIKHASLYAFSIVDFQKVEDCLYPLWMY